MNKKVKLGILFLLVCIVSLEFINSLPNEICVLKSQTVACDFDGPVKLVNNTKNEFSISGKNSIKGEDVGEYTCDMKLFGLIKIKSTNVKVIDSKKVYPIGLPVGLYLKTDGVMVAKTSRFKTEKGKSVYPAKGIEKGDYITAINNIQVSNKAQLVYLINRNGHKKMILTIKNTQEVKQIEVMPYKNSKGIYMVGIWVRDDTQGIGTVTFADAKGNYKGLGHGINDLDTGELLNSSQGNIYNANIWGIKKGKVGEPGGICGTIDYDENNIIGTINGNTESGIGGVINTNIIESLELKSVPIGLKKDVKIGEAYIQLVLDGKVEKYKVYIERLDSTRNDKNMIIRIDDDNLLNKTNGIVQGMSGCPIIQNGKLIGAITHVLVNDPERGYGILIENML